jgi:hypothetical protein
MKKLRALLFLICGTLQAATYYVSASGLDSNNGTGKATSWAHLPGMTGCANTCASTTPAAGDTFILKGGDTWGYASLPVIWEWSGSSGSPITITVDATWYTGGSWTRPIFDAEKTVLSPNTMFRAVGPISYVSMDSIELKGLACTGECAGQQNFVACYGDCDHMIFDNLYMHGWNIVTDALCTIITAPGATNVVSDSIIDGSDATGASPAGGTCRALYGRLPGTITRNVIHDLANGIIGSMSVAEISHNKIYNIIESNTGSHPNALELLPATLDGNAPTYYVHNNVIHDNLGETLFFGNHDETMYFWNNVIYAVNGNMPEGANDSSSTNIKFYAYNNTVVSPTSQLCWFLSGQQSPGGSYDALEFKNNLCITTGATVASTSWLGTAPTFTTNSLRTPSAAASAGYSAGSTYAYFPPEGVSEIGGGTNLSAQCAGPLASLCSDSTYGNSRTAVPRGTTWDIGAYEYARETWPTTLGPGTWRINVK